MSMSFLHIFHLPSCAGQSEYLRDFESERQKFVVPVMATIEALFRLYSSSFGPVVFARGVGLQAVNALPMAKVKYH